MCYTVIWYPEYARVLVMSWYVYALLMYCLLGLTHSSHKCLFLCYFVGESLDAWARPREPAIMSKKKHLRPATAFGPMFGSKHLMVLLLCDLHAFSFWSHSKIYNFHRSSDPLTDHAHFRTHPLFYHYLPYYQVWSGYPNWFYSYRVQGARRTADPPDRETPAPWTGVLWYWIAGFLIFVSLCLLAFLEKEGKEPTSFPIPSSRLAPQKLHKMSSKSTTGRSINCKLLAGATTPTL